MHKKINISLFLATLFTTLVAQEIELKPILITSTAIKTDELKSSDAVEIYTASDIQRAKVSNLYEFLNQQTSLFAMPSFGNSFSQKLDIHGYGMENGYQNIVITLNGRKLNNIDIVSQLLASIQPSSIEKIEIIKSGGIVLGGDGANAGVINITTKSNNDKEMAFYGGTYGMKGANTFISHTTEKFAITANGELQDSDGARTIDADGNKDENSLATGGLEVKYFASQELELKAGVLSARADITYGGVLTKSEYEQNPKQQGSGTASRQKYDTDAFNLGVRYSLSSSTELVADYAQELKKSNFVTYGSVSDYIYNSAKIALEVANGGFSLTAGADLFDGTRESYPTTWSIENKTDKENTALFLMTGYVKGSNSFKAGVRGERVGYRYSDILQSLKQDNSLFGAELGYNRVLDKKNSLFANYAHGYEAPDIDRFFNKDWFGVVTFNGFINPTKSDTLTIGYNRFDKNNKLKISLFYADLKDEIYYYSVSSKNTNIDDSHKWGIDVYDKWLITQDVSAVINYNFVKAKIDKEVENGEDYSGNDLPGVSEHTIKATLNYMPTSNITLGLTQTYRSEAYAFNDFANNFSQKQEEFISTDVSAAYSVEKMEFFAKINNLFNRKNALWIEDDAIYPLNFTTTIMAGLKARF
ncbi:MAG: TonB-dependent receptor [Sulfurimonas sp.]|uniref:TonB-dependent receptor n=1 Tax=Sulfurimonas sp. TaxID=2022749 RepID=UPI002608DA30|nr:TonB-dependent receptor [Sulfurimonas sp.]MDD2651893.1 TonB-dependent receptor [Sulfurimonas sp.]MDD3451790.1 TonB-dependent receptor [Sulfurimonas sp.]